MVYQGLPFVFGFNKIGEGCGLIGQHAACIMRGIVYWMNTGNFFALSSAGATPLPCSVWDFVFQDLDEANQHKCIAAPNSAFDEIAFYFPSLSGGTGEIDSFVKYNIDESGWDFGRLSRTAWIDQTVLGQPIGTTPQGLIFQHETSNDGDGQPIDWYFQTGYFVIAEGQDFSFVDWFFPDMKFGKYGQAQNATVMVTFYVVDYPNATPRTYGPYNMNQGTTFINTRLRGRQISVKFEGNDIGTFARLGLMRFRMASDGRR